MYLQLSLRGLGKGTVFKSNRGKLLQSTESLVCQVLQGFPRPLGLDQIINQPAKFLLEQTALRSRAARQRRVEPPPPAQAIIRVGSFGLEMQRHNQGRYVPDIELKQLNLLRTDSCQCIRHRFLVLPHPFSPFFFSICSFTTFLLLFCPLLDLLPLHQHHVLSLHFSSSPPAWGWEGRCTAASHPTEDPRLLALLLSSGHGRAPSLSWTSTDLKERTPHL